MSFNKKPTESRNPHTRWGQIKRAKRPKVGPNQISTPTRPGTKVSRPRLAAGGTQRARWVIANRTHRCTGHRYQISRSPTWDGHSGLTNLVIAAIPASVYPSGHPVCCARLGCLWHPHTSRWSCAGVVFGELLFELVDTSIGNTDAAACFGTGDRIPTVQPHPSKQHSQTSTVLA
jgi:hypothetical protein